VFALSEGNHDNRTFKNGIHILFQMNTAPNSTTNTTPLLEKINAYFTNLKHIKNQLNYMKRILTLLPENQEVERETEHELNNIRRLFDATVCGSHIFPIGTPYVYVWELTDGKYYVGWSENLRRRLDEHMSGEGAVWTKKFKPVSIMEIVRGDKETEKQKTLEYMRAKGFENVRGSLWCNTWYKVMPQEVQDFITHNVVHAKH
jgi:predicted GIY-YIG superfamily endonuclease